MNDDYPPAPYFVPKAQDPFYKKEKKRLFSRIGFALLLFEVIVALAQFLLLFICARWFPRAFNWSDFALALNAITQYAIAFPAFLIMIAGVPKEAPKKRRLGAEGWITFLAVSFFLMVAGGYIAEWLMAALSAWRGETVTNAVSDMIENSSPLGNLIAVCILGPVFEEILFRKLLIDRLLPCSETLAIVMSGVLFGLVHGNLYQFFYAAFSGILFGYVYVRTGRIVITIAMHMIINFAGSFVTDFLNEMTAGTPEGTVGFWSIINGVFTAAVYLLALFGLLLLIVKRKKISASKEGTLDLPLGLQFNVEWLNAGMVIFTVFCALSLTVSIFI